MSLFPADDKARKGMPIFKLVTRYFPKALREVTKVSVANNVRYNPDRDPFDINWSRGKSPDQLGSLFRHMMERAVDGKKFEGLSPNVAKLIGYDRVYVLAEAAWRALAALELEIEEVEAEQSLPNEGTNVPNEGSSPTLADYFDELSDPMQAPFIVRAEHRDASEWPKPYPYESRGLKEGDQFWHATVGDVGDCGVPDCYICGSNAGG